MSVVQIPSPFRPYTNDLKQVEIQGETIGAVLQQLAQEFPNLQKYLFDDLGALQPYVNLFLNKDDVRTLKGQDTPVKEDDHLRIVPSIAGGAALLR
ncbi:MAG: MoaD/ThiS family protein [Candidatus Promineifilaceae bacterium]